MNELSQPSVLIIDDEESLASTISEFLRQAGYNCTSCTQYDDALSKLSQSPFNVVVTDLRLQSRLYGGLDLAKLARERNAFVVLMTGYGDYEAAKQGINVGVNYFLEKPFELHRLGEILDRAQVRDGSLKEGVERILVEMKLTPKELEVCRLLLRGMSNKQIAGTLGNTEKTAKTHITSIYKKCGVTSRAEFFSKIFPVG